MPSGSARRPAANNASTMRWRPGGYCASAPDMPPDSVEETPMNIQMILSALPTQPSGKLESGTGQGQFALALTQAANASQAGSEAMPNHMPTQLSSAWREGLPSTMAAQQALLQALNTHVEKPVEEGIELAQPNAQLSEIMARLALIEGNGHAPLDANLQSLVTDLPPPDDTELPAMASTSDMTPTVDTAMPLDEQPQVAALAAAAANPLRPAESQPTAGIARPDMPAASAGAVSVNPLAAQLGNGTTTPDANITDAERNTNGASRAIDPATVFAKSQSGAPELRTMAADQPRGGFVPEAASMTQPSANTSTTTSIPGQAVQQPTQASLTAPLQSPAWPNQLGQQLVQFARHGGEQQVEMRLNPAELGPLSVTLKMTEQGAQAQFLSSHAQVRQVLEQAIPQLREALAEQGISLGDTSVGEQRRQDAQAFAGNDGRRGQGGSSQGDEAAALPGMEENGVTPSSATLPLDGRVNLYA
ncbi:MAG: flagellar hook-length control protein FliK [Halomonas sp.]|nr:flagellar hook-length control protein FliK [Halomonas sp.]